MQLQKYDDAAKAWEAFIAKYAKKTADKAKELSGEGKADDLPTVADAMWKLALSYQKLNQADKAKAMCETLIATYAQSTEAGNARKLLAQL
jgi:TolA-binding protein